MNLRDIRTIREVAEETGINVKTLTKRLDLESCNMIEGEDFKRLGDRMPIILSPKGIEKILKK